MYSHPTNFIEAEPAIKTLKNKKSPGEENIKAETLKEICSEIFIYFY